MQVSWNIGRLCILAAALATVAASGTTLLERNNVQVAGRRKDAFTTTWTKIVHNPPYTLEVPLGGRVELECNVTGNPPPELYWITGNDAENEIAELKARAQEEGNIVPTTWRGVSMLSSKYVINCAGVEDQGPKYCVSVSRNVVALSEPTRLLVNTSRPIECDDDSQPPTIALHTVWRFALRQNTVVLRCRGVSQPEPYLLWLDNLGNTITPTTHNRHRVLPNGDLEIIELRWGDMGEYVCIVQSEHKQKTASVFLYVVLPDGEKKTHKT